MDPRSLAAHPPKARLAVTLGVVGHRPNRLPEAARERVMTRIGEVLDLLTHAVDTIHQQYSATFAEERPHLTLISGLAEGADRMAAQAALARGYTLTAVLPFAVDEYEKDFPDKTGVADYRALLEKADPVLALCGTRTAEASAYEEAGLTILDNVDIVLAVWDGGPSAGRGGTTELVERAARDKIPIIHIDALGGKSSRLIWSGLDESGIAPTDLVSLPAKPLGDSVKHVVDAIVRPPSDPNERRKLTAYLSERWKSLNWRLELPVLMHLLGVRRLKSSDFRPAAPDSAAKYVVDVMRDGGDKDRMAAIAAAYGWADAAAVRYAQIFRSAYISNFFFAAMAVAMAAGSLVVWQVFAGAKWPLVLLEVAFIAWVVANTLIGRRRDWHGRWLESREAAERIRAAVPLWLLGRRPDDARGIQPTWTGWYVSVQLRALGVRQAQFDPIQLDAIRGILRNIIYDQRAYHANAAETMSKLERRLEGIGMILFALTLAAAVGYLLASLVTSVADEWMFTITALTAGLPALATATYGMRLIGDFEGTAKRSRRTEAALERIDAILQRQQVQLSALRNSAQAISAVMLGDVSHWRLASETRELAIPG